MSDACMCIFGPECNGLGTVYCSPPCGGDLCVCTCGGEMECGGCWSCGGPEDFYRDEWDPFDPRENEP